MITPQSIAQEIYIELESPETTTVNSIRLWIEGNFAKLNSRLFLDITLVNGFFEPQIDADYAAVLKTLYLSHHYTVKKRKVLLLGSDIISVTEGDTTIRRGGRAEHSKQLGTIIEGYNQELEALILSYKMNKLKFKGIQLEPI